MNWSNKQKRCFGTALSGLVLAELRNENVRFLTLTTSNRGSNLDITKDWQILDKRIQRKFDFKPEYIRVKTNEGNGVLHIIYKGKYLPQKWLSNAWNEIHYSPIVSIEWVRNNKQLASYLTQYISNQNSTYQRYSCSHYWIAPGYAKVRDKLKKSYRDYSKQFYCSYVDSWVAPVDFDRYICEWRRYLYSLCFDTVPSICWITDNYTYDYVKSCSISYDYNLLQSSLSDFG